MRYYIFFFFLFLFSSATGQRSDGFKVLVDTASFKQKMEKESQSVSTIESDFVQEKYLSVMSEKIISKGHFWFKKSNLLRWEYTNPYNYLIILNKSKISIKDNNKVNTFDVSANKMFKSINEIMINAVVGNLFNNKDYGVTYFENDKNYLLELTPLLKGASLFLKTIQLYVAKSDYGIVKVKMIEPGNDYTSIDFINRVKNQPIGDEKFTTK